MSDKPEVLSAAIVERRGSPRRRTLLGAQIIFRGGICSMSGHILNLSDTGALLRPIEIALCPNNFVLRPRFDPPHECEVVWRKGEVLGVRFVS
jgi:hypothetical protein